MTPSALQGGDDVEQVADLRFAERRRRLVEDQQAGVERQRLGDLDELLLADAQRLDLSFGGDRQHETVEECSGELVHRRRVEQPGRVVQLAAEIDVLGDGQLGDQVELLVDDGDPVALGVARAVQHQRLAVHRQLARVVRVRAAEDLHQRALARPVLADDGVDLPGGDVEGHVVQGAYPGERLADSPDLEHSPSAISPTVLRAVREIDLSYSTASACARPRRVGS